MLSAIFFFFFFFLMLYLLFVYLISVKILKNTKRTCTKNIEIEDKPALFKTYQHNV